MPIKNSLSNILLFHSDLKIAKELVYDKCGFELTEINIHAESVEYGACSFKLNGKIIQHRVSKITPTKVGQFVTIWKRNNQGITEPFDSSDNLDFVIITARSGENFGQFIFPTSVLAQYGILTHNGKVGKRGIRVYTPWDIAANKQAIKTQLWQTNYFMPIKDNNSTDFNLITKLLTQTN